MIMGSHQPIAIGTRWVGMVDPLGTHRPKQPCVILRAATADEFIAQQAGLGVPMPPNQVAFIASGKAFFYEVSVD